ncbi:MAG: CocE/NonD family hydrolase [Acidimicrobiia bacterium]
MTVAFAVCCTVPWLIATSAMADPGSAGASPAAAEWTPGPAVYGIGTATNLEVAMDDGVILRVDVKYPLDAATGLPATGPFPVLLTQTPYGKNSPILPLLAGDIEGYLVPRGYIAVIADVRGRGGSEGEFELWSDREALDGVALANWAAALPNSNGKVGLYGGSYMGITQLRTSAIAGPNSPIKASVPEVAINDVARDGLYGGMPNGGFGLLYAGLFLGTGVTAVPDYLGLTDPVDLAQRTLEALGGSAAFGGGMLFDFVTGGPLAFAGPEWDAKSPVKNIEQIAANNVPTFLIGGWYDVMGKGPLMNFTGLQNASVGRDKRAPMLAGQVPDGRFQVLVGPWTHAGVDKNVADQVRLRWFDHYLKGVDNGVEQTDTPVHLNLLGTDRWVDASRWPLSETTSTVYHLAPGPAGGSAFSLNDGKLTTTAPRGLFGQDTMAWTGVSSPCSVQLKVQTAGLLNFTGVPLDGACGPEAPETTELGSLTYTTDPFTAPKVIAGPMDLTLYASSTTLNAEFIVNVERIRTDGSVESVTAGALLGSQRALDETNSWRDASGRIIQPFHPFTQQSQAALIPGAVNKFEIGIWPTAMELQAGERLRITLRSSDIPFALPGINLIPGLVGGIYNIQRNGIYPSSLVVPTADPAAFNHDCVVCTVAP